MNIYGELVTDEMEQAHGKVVRLGTFSGVTDRMWIARVCNRLKKWLLR